MQLELMREDLVRDLQLLAAELRSLTPPTQASHVREAGKLEVQMVLASDRSIVLST
jgi:hypothetical protein